MKEAKYQDKSKININESGNGKCVDCKKPALIGNYWCAPCAYNHFRKTYSDYKNK